jgi:hypothetical protein
VARRTDSSLQSLKEVFDRTSHHLGHLKLADGVLPGLHSLDAQGGNLINTRTILTVNKHQKGEGGTESHGKL